MKGYSVEMNFFIVLLWQKKLFTCTELPITKKQEDFMAFKQQG